MHNMARKQIPPPPLICMFSTGVTFHGIQVSAGILYHKHPRCTSGPRWDVACSVAKAFSCDIFAGLPGALLPGASLMTQFGHSSCRVQM